VPPSPAPAVVPEKVEGRIEFDEVTFYYDKDNGGVYMVPAFAAMGQVRSILAPYLCPSCGDESLELVTIAEETEGHEFPPPRLCANCGQPLQFDELADEYFAFLDK